MRWRQAARFWHESGARNPFGVILTGDDCQPREWDRDAFFRTGVEDVERVMSDLRTLAPSLRLGSALDFGCGVGRISRGLASHFAQVVGVDVAPSMIAAAQEQNADVARCSFRVNRAGRLGGIADQAFDFVYSRLVLQHIPPRAALRYVDELVRVLAPGGVLMFQLPEPIELDRDEAYRAERRAFISAPIADTPLKRRVPPCLIRLNRRVRFRLLVPPARGRRMHMFGVPREIVVERLRREDVVLLRIDEDRSHGEGKRGYVYWVTKRTPGAWS